MEEKKRKTKNWTKDETGLFARVLANSDKGFIDPLEKKALKKEANSEVFKAILNKFRIELEDENFILENEMNNFREPLFYGQTSLIMNTEAYVGPPQKPLKLVK